MGADLDNLKEFLTTMHRFGPFVATFGLILRLHGTVSIFTPA